MAFAIAGQDVAAAPAGASDRSRRAVRIWIYGLAALVIAMVAVGGATRLTGSGLSITEWRPVTGAIPPLSEAAWVAEFEKYRQSPQYHLLNQGMSLAEFKFIYAWEWGHRQLGRLIGVFFLVPLVWFWSRGMVRGRLALTLLAIGALGGLQGAVGWIMVASGLEPGMTAVAPMKLALHLLIASAILASLIWVAVGLRMSDSRLPTSASEFVAARGSTGKQPGRGPEAKLEATVPSPTAARERERITALRRGAFILLGLIFLQIALGGLVAGSKAGLTYNTWPLMDGRLAPPFGDLFAVRPVIENFVDNVALVQFNHRLGAYLVVGFALWHMASAWRLAPASAAARHATGLAGLALAQMALGILTLILVVPLWAGLLHQVFGMLVLGLASAHARLCAGRASLP